jgi:DNA end-binding protein Ku
MYYPDEIRDTKGYGDASTGKLKQQELELSEQFAKALVKPFHAAEFHDEYTKRVEKLIEDKTKGKVTQMPAKPRQLAPVVDLMDALKKSLAAQGKSERPKTRKLRKSA